MTENVPPHLREKQYLERSLAELLKKQEVCKQQLAALLKAQKERDEKTMDS